jgi:hypothetical protein
MSDEEFDNQLSMEKLWCVLIYFSQQDGSWTSFNNLGHTGLCESWSNADINIHCFF